MEQISAPLLCAEGDFVVVLKPVGVESEKELPALLAAELGGAAADFHPVHRLDKAVGGVMVFARNARAAADLSRQVQERVFQKEYLAAAGGVPTPAEGLMRDFLYKDSAKGKSFPVKRLRRGVKEAELEYRTLAVAKNETGTAALVAVTLHTGRFHQVRAQFAARGLPLLGDGKYGSRDKGCDVALFSRRIAFCPPGSRELRSFEAAPPEVYPWNLFADK